MPNDGSLRRVLVVDDDTDAAEALVDILGHSGYEAAAVHDGKQALKHLKAEQLPNVMILDLFMPHMNGWDLMRELKRSAELSNIPIIVVSAFAYAPGIEADAVLSKPVDMDALLSTMMELVTQDSKGH
jgi:CheY-like chemotaxis protein